MTDYEVRRRETIVREEPVVQETYVERAPVVQAQHEVVEDPSASGRMMVARIQIIWLLFAILDVLIVLRIGLELIAANPTSGFANFIYSITSVFLAPFNALVASPALGSGSFFDVPAVIALIVYTLLAWGIVRLFRLIFTPARTQTSVTTYRREM